MKEVNEKIRRFISYVKERNNYTRNQTGYTWTYTGEKYENIFSKGGYE
jgi:hypothetical protein